MPVCATASLCNTEWVWRSLSMASLVLVFVFFKQKTAYEMLRSLVGSEMCIRDRYYRGRVSKITEENGKLIVRGADTLTGAPVAVEADLVVLAAAMRPAIGVLELAQKIKLGYDEFGFLSESHPKLRPVETNTAGVYICGACHAPKDIPEAVAQASAAAGKVQVLFSKGELLSLIPI